MKGLAVAVGLHGNCVETVLHMHDGMPRFKDVPGDMGGSGENVPE